MQRHVALRLGTAASTPTLRCALDQTRKAPSLRVSERGQGEGAADPCAWLGHGRHRRHHDVVACAASVIDCEIVARRGRYARKCARDRTGAFIVYNSKLVPGFYCSRTDCDRQIAAVQRDGSSHVELIILGARCCAVDFDDKIRTGIQCD